MHDWCTVLKCVEVSESYRGAPWCAFPCSGVDSGLLLQYRAGPSVTELLSVELLASSQESTCEAAYGIPVLASQTGSMSCRT
eukprot:1980845-Amphidinium_carterae.1